EGGGGGRPATRDGVTPLRDPYERRDPRERRAPHERRSRRDGYEPFDAYEVPHRRRPAANGSYGSSYSSSTHHPISRVRYRGSGDDEDAREEYRARPRARSSEAESWEYDI